MKKYTVIYGRWFRTGSHSNSVTCYKHIETRNLRDALENDEDFQASDVWFVFYGHCEPEASFADVELPAPANETNSN